MKDSTARKISPAPAITAPRAQPKPAKPKSKTPWRSQRFSLGGEARQKSWLDLVR